MTAAGTAPVRSHTPRPAVRRVLNGTTPRRYRAASVALVVLVLALLAAGSKSYLSARDATNGLRHNTGPVLVATQLLVASLGEADAAATAAFLSGNPEDRDQRNLYEDAIDRADHQLEQVSSLIGDDTEAHRILQTLGAEITRYAGLVEAARAENLNGVAAAKPTLVGAVNLLSSAIAGDAARLTTVSQRRYATEAAHRRSGEPITVAIAVIVLAGLVGAQLDLARRSHRLFNLPLVLATVVVAGAAVWVVRADVRAGADLTAGRRDGYDSIVLTARIQSEAFAAKSDETLALITGDTSKRSAADQAADAVGPRDIANAADKVRNDQPVDAKGLLVETAAAADSARERAAVAELLQRWTRYRDSVTTLRASSGDAARLLAIGETSSAFNGFNVTVESVLGDNRTQFTTALNQAAGRYRGLNIVIALGSLLGAALLLAGYQLRIREYR